MSDPFAGPVAGPFAGISRLVFVWNADWSIGGALRAAADFVRGVESCALCDIAYSGIKEKRAFKDCKASIPVPIEALCRNQLDDRLAAAADGEFPAVIAERDGELSVVMGPAAIEACQGDVDAFKAALEAAVAAQAT